jgi:hypothetical protein
MPTVLEQWESGFQPRMALFISLRHPAALLRELRRHWPNGIEATVAVGGPFNNWPRLPFQLASAASRATAFLTARS